MIIRKAKIEDAVKISEHLFLAMEGFLYEFIGMRNSKQAKKFLHYFVEKENNQYSYKNCFVAETDRGIEGTINIYDGAELDKLRKPIVKYISEHFNLHFKPENETQKGEHYIDSFGVDPKSQGRGIGTKMLHFIINRFNLNQQTLGLLVDDDNTKAEKLYLNLGFELVDTKVLTGKKMKHLQKKPTKDN
ncbi:GNAT family N-acetyltransferase [Maribacter ulvicola]|uniref:Acetyltransferase (GNAT) family protein n=1 Tax=Maribacter ulvicola TaxID=228959 RepID=A0A1N6ZF31_9FLAO|nr:GNAT family N-acetyltransferase [Maribacter ulvicola]SIR25500.1 Acetyltransferase (GNAT) family protein [Maribacter ulvicola]